MSCHQSPSKISLGLVGYGKFGQEIAKCALEKGFKVPAIIQKNEALSPLQNVDVIVDVANGVNMLNRIQELLLFKKPLIIATTGWEEHLAEIKELTINTQGTVLYSPNFSLGLMFFSKIVEAAAQLFPFFPEYAVGGIEIHHDKKCDSPSGTAKKLSNFFPQKVPFNSVRLGHFSGTHSLVFDSISDTITLTHEARSKKGFAEGVLKTAEWIIDQKGWLTLEDMFRTLYSSRNSL